MLDGGIDMSATFDSHLLKCNCRSFKSERNVLTPSLCVGRTDNASSKGCGFDSRSGRHCAMTVGKLTFLATMQRFIKLIRSLVILLGQICQNMTKLLQRLKGIFYWDRGYYGDNES